jgi:hypothetical protein
MSTDVSQEEIDSIPVPEGRPRSDRLKRLLEWMEQPAEGREGRRFDFGVFRSACGTCGCLGGELPAIWPEEWEVKPFPLIDGNFGVWRRGSETGSFDEHAMGFFGIEAFVVHRIFYPGIHNGLGREATLDQVLENLIRVILELEERERMAEAIRYAEPLAPVRRGR